MPERYGPWDRVHDLFRRRQRDGTWARIVTRPQAEADAKGLITWDVNIDSTVCRARQHAAGAAKRGSPEGTARRDHRRADRPRARTLPGGLTRKIHLAVEQGQKSLSVVITAGQRGDSPQFESGVGCDQHFHNRPQRPAVTDAVVRSGSTVGGWAVERVWLL
ncbi:putative transposase [Streptantibioticus cattleyicolor NRRL 8057 = DSM 46488]|uniref:Putative transposase n=1 Tax=Streptantibioticus cattleyicolor (strain ATCC 35852 / DSM 46488 / JCM 4925 / NBRC 14057 / NRRL 8057) TaxID=1003195 RepID=G8WPQ1_STREN|nr:putative transposase [Streptantibioticus cattleyicolor NRRL 8057 = DSM 46488]